MNFDIRKWSESALISSWSCFFTWPFLASFEIGLGSQRANEPRVKYKKCQKCLRGLFAIKKRQFRYFLIFLKILALLVNTLTSKDELTRFFNICRKISNISLTGNFDKVRLALLKIKYNFLSYKHQFWYLQMIRKCLNFKLNLLFHEAIFGLFWNTPWQSTC